MTTTETARNLWDLLDVVTVTRPVGDGDRYEVRDYAECYLAIVQTLDGTLEANIGTEVDWAGQRELAARLIAELSSNDAKTLWEGALTGELRIYRIWDDGADEYHICATESEAQARAREYGESGDWDASGGTIWTDVSYQRRDESNHGRVTVELHPDEPDCADGHEHDWQSPIEIVGGIEDNPGVWGNGGGVKIHEICRHCGTHRHTDTWATNPTDGTQGHESISYEDADDESLGWVASERRSAIEVILNTDSAIGPFIEYAEGLNDDEMDDVRDVVPEGWTADWSSEVKLASGRRRSPLVKEVVE